MVATPLTLYIICCVEEMIQIHSLSIVYIHANACWKGKYQYNIYVVANVQLTIRIPTKTHFIRLSLQCLVIVGQFGIWSKITSIYLVLSVENPIV